MPIMKNVSQRKFVVAGKELKPNQQAEFAQSVISRHVSMYKGELSQVDAPQETKEEAAATEAKKTIAQMSKAEIGELLKEKGIEFSADAKKAELVELLG